MSIKNKIIAGVIAFALAVGFVPLTAKAASIDFGALSELLSQVAAIAADKNADDSVMSSLQSVVSQISSIISSQVAGNSSSANQSTTGSSQAAGTNDEGSTTGYNEDGSTFTYQAWGKDPATGACILNGAKQGWQVYSSKASCEAAKAACVISGNACVQNGKSYPLTNTCKSGYTPAITTCLNYGTYCVPSVGCKYAGGATMNKTCLQACAELGIPDKYGRSASCTWNGVAGSNGLDDTIASNIIGPTVDCDAKGSYSCECRLIVDKYIGLDPSRPAYLYDSKYLGDDECEAACHDRGYQFGGCRLDVKNNEFSATGLSVYVGETNTCKSGANYKAGCFCNIYEGMGGIGSWIGAGTKADGQKCASNTECKSGNCSYNYCAPQGGCGGVKEPYYFANGASASNEWLSGICRTGVWKTVSGGVGCNSFGCDSGVCTNNKCVGTAATKKANGEMCTAAADCVSGVCSYTYCVPDSSHCGGVRAPFYHANGLHAKNEWLEGVCRDGVWKTDPNGIGCNSFACDGSEANCVNNKCVVTSIESSQNGPKKANGQHCQDSSECISENCSYTYCVPSSDYCGGIKEPFYFANGVSASNEARTGICRNGVWKISLNGIGCKQLPCDEGTCVNDTCVAENGSATTKKANGQQCVSSSNCISGNCSYNYCVPDSSYCGGVKEPMYFADRATASNQWLDGICRFGVWRTVTGGIGCNLFACYSSNDACVNNKCVANSVAIKKANGEPCMIGSDCVSGSCSYTYCVPDSSHCGGVKEPMYFANGASASNQWLTGICRNGVWKAKLNGVGCNTFGCDSGTCVNDTCR